MNVRVSGQVHVGECVAGWCHWLIGWLVAWLLDCACVRARVFLAAPRVLMDLSR